MKNLVVTLILIIPFVGQGQNAGVNNQSAAQPASTAAYQSENYSMNKSMESTFTANSLDERQVSTFQERSIQKLKDFYNYLTIISNPNIDKRLRENSKVQAKQLFYGSDCKVDGKLATAFIDSCFNLNSGGEWGATEINVNKDMSPDSTGSTANIYRGELSFKESVNSIVSGVKKAEIILSKSEKQFGNSRREVWTVFICFIE